MAKAIRQAIIVLGMHRSGTSALAGALGMLGMRLPTVLLPTTADNPKGYFESGRIVAIHDRLLVAAGTNWSGVESLTEDWFRTAEASAFVDELVAAVRQDFGDAATFVVKDPRMCRLMPLWRRVLDQVGAQGRYAIPLRNPLEVARSLEKRDGLPLAQGCLLWLRNMLDAERETRGSPRVFVHYQDLLADPVQISTLVAFQLTEEKLTLNKKKKANISSLIDPKLRHHMAKPEDLHLDEAFYPWLWKAYEAFAALVDRPTDKAPQRQLDRVRAVFDRAVVSFAPILAAREKKLAEQNAEISALGRTLIEHHRRLASLGQAVVERDGRLVSLGQAVAERDGQIASLGQAAVERDKKIVQLGQAVAERDGQIASLGHAVAERDGQIASLGHAVAERDGRLVSLGQAAAERDGQIASLSHAVAARDKKIVNLGQAVAERDGQIASLDQTATARDEQVRSLTNELQEIYGSTVWRLIAPVRWYGRLRQRTARLLRKLAAMLSRREDSEIRRSNLPSASEANANLADQATLFSEKNGHIYRCSLVIPTKNGGALFGQLVDRLRTQTCWPEVEFIVIDSGSTDETIPIARSAGAIVHSIPPHEFNHGSTRDYGISLASTDHVILMVQDAIPHQNVLIERLLSALAEDGVAGAYARQLPQPTADVITKRNLNSWLTGGLERKVKSIESLDWYESLSPMEKYFFCNFDNVCSAINKQVWKEERFGRADFGEDIDWAERVLKRKFKIVYEPGATVIHSHSRSLLYNYKRTYICHRMLYRKFGLHLVPSLRAMWPAWLETSASEMMLAARTEKRIARKLLMLLTIPVTNLLAAIGQYRAVQHEIRGIDRKARDV
jgi:glycosyltransferase involved in cell wall biosynthesis